MQRRCVPKHEEIKSLPQKEFNKPLDYLYGTKRHLHCTMEAQTEDLSTSSFWENADFGPPMDYYSDGCLQAQLHAKKNPEFTFVCHLGESLGPYKGTLAGSVRLTRPANQSAEGIETALDNFYAKLKKMIMSSYEDEPRISSDESHEKYFRFEKAFDSINAWKRRFKGDQ